jgi:hypothetical protein
LLPLSLELSFFRISALLGFSLKLRNSSLPGIFGLLLLILGLSGSGGGLSSALVGRNDSSQSIPFGAQLSTMICVLAGTGWRRSQLALDFSNALGRGFFELSPGQRRSLSNWRMQEGNSLPGYASTGLHIEPQL